MSVTTSSAAPALAKPAIMIDAGAGDNARRAFDYATLAGGVAKLARDTAAKMRNWQRRAVADMRNAAPVGAALALFEG